MSASTIFPDPDLAEGEVVGVVRGYYSDHIGLVRTVPYQKMYVIVQFGSDGPYSKQKVTNLRRVSRARAQPLKGVGGALIREDGQLVEL
jgi:hypothetical protein